MASERMRQEKGLKEKLNDFANSGVLSMHMPGHKRNLAKFPYLKNAGGNIDITEIEGFDNLHDAKGVLRDLSLRAAEMWNCKRSFLSVNGSTAAVFAALKASTHRGDKILVARNAHRSVFNAIELLGLKSDWIYPNIVSEYGICGSVNSDDIKTKLQSDHYKAVVVTSPTYEGVISDIKSISNIVHESGAVLIVDGAHGAHLDLSEYFKGSGVSDGADLVVCGVHKTLPALTQTAFLHVCLDRVDEEAVAEAMSVFVTSSPSYVLMSSVDGMLNTLHNRGGELFRELDCNLKNFYSVTKKLNVLRVVNEDITNSNHVFEKDPSKIYIDCTCAAFNGYDLKAKLRKKYSIEVEYATLNGVLCISGIGDDEADFKRLANAINDIDAKCCDEERLIKGEKGKESLSLSSCPQCAKAFEPWEKDTMNDATECVAYANSVGRVSAETVWIFPPAIPVVTKGEIISQECADYITACAAGGADIGCSSSHEKNLIRVFA